MLKRSIWWSNNILPNDETLLQQCSDLWVLASCLTCCWKPPLEPTCWRKKVTRASAVTEAWILQVQCRKYVGLFLFSLIFVTFWSLMYIFWEMWYVYSNHGLHRTAMLSNWTLPFVSAAPPTGNQKVFHFSGSPPSAVFAMGSPLNGNTPPDDVVPKMLSGRWSYLCWYVPYLFL